MWQYAIVAMLVQAPAARDARAPEPQTKLERFLAVKGKMVVKEFHELLAFNALGRIELTAITLFEPGNEASKIRGMRVTVTEASRLERSEAAFLDLEEIQGLADALGYMEKAVADWTLTPPPEYTELEFSTLGGFRAGVFFMPKDKKSGAVVSCGQVIRASAYPKVEDFTKIREAASAGLSYLRGR